VASTTAAVLRDGACSGPVPCEILAQLEAFCAEQRTGKIEIDIKTARSWSLKATETLFDTNRAEEVKVDRPKNDM
jgi:hypothetical protein